ncbi:MAG: hypothetical protein AAF899_02395 [Pseudomonadota bacterium]
MSAVSAAARLDLLRLDPAGGHADMATLDDATLRVLEALLPHGLTAPILRGVRNGAIQARRTAAQPHLEPASWPKAFRMMTALNNSRAGIMSGPLGQMIRKNPKGMPLSLRGRIVWNRRSCGDVVIMGRWADLTAALSNSGLSFETKFGDTRAEDVNAQFDEMYGSLPESDEARAWRLKGMNAMPLCVSLEGGAAWRETDADHSVVLNAPGAVMQVAAGRLAGLCSAVAPLPTAGLAETGIAADLLGLAGPSAATGAAAWRIDKALYTLIIGIGPAGPKYTLTGAETLTGLDVLAHALALRDAATKPVAIQRPGAAAA